MGTFDFQHLTAALFPAVMEAGRLEMQHFASDLEIELKPDQSPVTAADREAEDVIVAALSRIAPDIPIVAEEAVAAGRIPPPAKTFFLVDALDGTRLFVRKKPEFSVNIALVDDGEPVFGLIYVPPTGALYVTLTPGQSHLATAPCAAGEMRAFKDLLFRRLHTRAPATDDLTAFNSRSAGAKGKAFMEAVGVKHARPVGSSLKFCLIAAGEGDLYVRFGETSEWDTAAGQAILEGAGGSVVMDDGKRLVYGKAADTYRNPHFVAWGRAPLLTRFHAPQS